MPIIDVTAIRFVIVGLLNTLVGLSVIYLAMYLLGLGNALANALGYAVGLVVSFVLNKRWTFSHRGQTASAFLRFVTVVGVAYLTNLGTVLFFADGLGWNRYVAQALGIPPYTVVSYFGSRLFAFPQKRAPASPTQESARVGAFGK
jgi:putative flippase GtrA